MDTNPDYITPEGEELYYWELENRTEELLDDVYPLFQVGDLGYEAGRVLREIDPIAFNETVQAEIHSLTEDEELDEWREDHPWRESDEEEDEEVEWSAIGPGKVGATRANGDRLTVSRAPSYTSELHVWEVLVISESGCCEYLTELEDMFAADAMAHAEEVDLYADATGTDEEDCPNCKH